MPYFGYSMETLGRWFYKEFGLMPYYGYSMETRGRWVKLPDGTFGVKTDGCCKLVCSSLQGGLTATRSKSHAVYTAAWFALRRV